jgi:hypothetical protein
MKHFVVVVILLFSCALTVHGDTVRLRDGLELVGRYLGGTQTQIWFERQGLVTTTEVIPTALVEALKFGPTIANPATPGIPMPSGPRSLPEIARAAFSSGGFRYLSTVLATAWFPYASSTLKEMVVSPGGRVIAMR